MNLPRGMVLISATYQRLSRTHAVSVIGLRQSVHLRALNSRVMLCFRCRSDLSPVSAHTVLIATVRRKSLHRFVTRLPKSTIHTRQMVQIQRESTKAWITAAAGDDARFHAP
jgi:hypothetical protein